MFFSQGSDSWHAGSGNWGELGWGGGSGKFLKDCTSAWHGMAQTPTDTVPISSFLYRTVDQQQQQQQQRQDSISILVVQELRKLSFLTSRLSGVPMGPTVTYGLVFSRPTKKYFKVHSI